MSDIFISYKAEDRARVRPLVEALTADGLSLWWDADIGAGDRWRETIAHNLDTAKCVIVAWSKRSTGAEGHFVRDEAARSVKRGVYLPVTIDKVDPPLGFGETQCLPLTGWKGDRDDPRYLALLDAARRIVGGDHGPSSSHAHTGHTATGSTPFDRRAVLVGGVVGGLALAGGGAWYWLHGSPANANSVAVLPFANLSGDPAQAYFSDGLAEEVRSALARISGLKVIGRTSSELVGGGDAMVAATRLGVATVVTGSVRRSPTTIRVSAQLVDGHNGVERWSQTFDRAPGDVLQIQTSIAEAVAQQLRSQLGTADRAALTLGGTTNAAAQDMVLKADANPDGSKAGFQARIALYDAAITLDPGYALAWAGKSRTMTSLAAPYANTPADGASELAAAAAIAEKAIALAPTLAEAHQALGLTREYALDFTGGWAEYQRAVASPGCSPRTLVSVATFLSQIGRFDDARKLIEQAASIDPLSPAVVRARLSLLFARRRYGEMIPGLQSLLAKEPTSTGVRVSLATALAANGQFAEAASAAAALPHEHPTWFVIRSVAAAHTGDRAGAAAILDDMRKLAGDSAHYQYAEMRAQLGDRDGAMAELEAAYKFRDPGLGLLPTDASLDPVRSHPRFAALVKRLNFPAV